MWLRSDLRNTCRSFYEVQLFPLLLPYFTTPSLLQLCLEPGSYLLYSKVNHVTMVAAIVLFVTRRRLFAGVDSHPGSNFAVDCKHDSSFHNGRMFYCATNYRAYTFKLLTVCGLAVWFHETDIQAKFIAIEAVPG